MLGPRDSESPCPQPAPRSAYHQVWHRMPELGLYFPTCQMRFGILVLPVPYSYGRMEKQTTSGEKTYRCPGLGPGAQNTSRTIWIKADGHQVSPSGLELMGQEGGGGAGHSICFPGPLQLITTDLGA